MFKKRKTEEISLREDGLTDYNIYIMGRREVILNILFAAIVLFGVGYVFYQSIILSALLALLAVKFPKIRTNQIIEKRKKQLTLQFKELLYALSSALSVGKSVETGLQDVLKDLQIIYPDPDTDILMEVGYILHGIGMNNTTEMMFAQFAERAHIEDIDNFVDIFVTCKRTGGDLMEVMRSTSNTIGDKIEIKQEIDTLISGKKFEFNVLMVLPVVMVLFLSATSADYMSPVFDTIAGRIAMTISIFIFIAAYVIGNKVMKIEV